MNILVLDTEVYSNTGGQASKATPRGAVAKFAAAGKGTAKKDLGAIARAYGNVYVAQVSMGANDLQTTKALLEADAWPGPSLVIAYSTCIAHGIDMSKSMSHQKDAVRSGYWPLYRFHPSEVEGGKPFKLDSSAPSIPIADFVATETRFAVLQRTHPERAAQLAELAQADADERWHYYQQLAGIERTVPHGHRPDPAIVPEVESEAGYRPGNGGDGANEPSTSAPAIWGSRSARPSSPRPRPRTGRSPRPARWRTRAWGRSSCPRCSRRRSWPRRSSSTEPSNRAPSTSPRRIDYFPAVDAFVGAADRYLASLERVKAAVGVPVIASLNASTAGGWVRHAQRIEQAGADALELNLYHVAADPSRTAAEMEAADLRLIAAVRAEVSIPLAVKVSPYYSAFANFAAAAVAAGADGLVLFNRFYQPDLDLESREVVPRLELSQPWELRLPVRWIAILRPQLGAAVSLAATSGVHAGTDVVKGLMVGADVVMMTSALLRHGPGHVAAVEAGLRAMDDRPRVRVGRATARKRQRGDRGRPVRIRARELHADDPLVGGPCGAGAGASR